MEAEQRANPALVVENALDRMLDEYKENPPYPNAPLVIEHAIRSLETAVGKWNTQMRKAYTRHAAGGQIIKAEDLAKEEIAKKDSLRRMKSISGQEPQGVDCEVTLFDPQVLDPDNKLSEQAKTNFIDSIVTRLAKALGVTGAERDRHAIMNDVLLTANPNTLTDWYEALFQSERARMVSMKKGGIDFYGYVYPPGKTDGVAIAVPLASHNQPVKLFMTPSAIAKSMPSAVPQGLRS